MPIDDDEIVRIVEATWVGFLGLSLDRVNTSRPEDDTSVTGVVQIAGGWEGTVLLVCAGGLARMASAAMLAMNADDLGAEEIRDAMGELVNMIAGNIKARVPNATHLSLPTVVEGRDYELTVPGSTVLNRVSFLCEGHNMQLRVLQRDRAA